MKKKSKKKSKNVKTYKNPTKKPQINPRAKKKIKKQIIRKGFVNVHEIIHALKLAAYAPYNIWFIQYDLHNFCNMPIKLQSHLNLALLIDAEKTWTGVEPIFSDLQSGAQPLC